MNKKAKRITVGLVAVLCFLLVFALGFGITGAWYEARRTATGTVTLDQGIIIDYKGFSESDDRDEWGKEANLLLFATQSGVPQKSITVPVAQIAKNTNSKVINFYVRAKVNYEYYLYTDAGEGNRIAGTTPYTADKLQIKNGENFEAATDASFIKTQLAFNSTNWTPHASDGWTYYTEGGALKPLPTTEVNIFDGNAMVLEDWTSEFGGPIVKLEDGEGNATGDEQEVAKIVVTLTLEAIQTDAGWTLGA